MVNCVEAAQDQEGTVGVPVKLANSEALERLEEKLDHIKIPVKVEQVTNSRISECQLAAKFMNEMTSLYVPYLRNVHEFMNETFHSCANICVKRQK